MTAFLTLVNETSGEKQRVNFNFVKGYIGCGESTLIILDEINIESNFKVKQTAEVIDSMLLHFQR